MSWDAEEGILVRMAAAAAAAVVVVQVEEGGRC